MRPPGILGINDTDPLGGRSARCDEMNLNRIKKRLQSLDSVLVNLGSSRLMDASMIPDSTGPHKYFGFERV